MNAASAAKPRDAATTRLRLAHEIALYLCLVHRDTQTRCGRYLDRAVNETHRFGDQIVLVVDAGDLTGLGLGRCRDRHHTGERHGGRGSGKRDVGAIADPGLDGAVDVADDARRPRHRCDLHGAEQAARFGGVDRHDLRGALFDDLDHVMRVPRALVGHYGSIDRTGHLGQAVDALDRLFEIADLGAGHSAEGADRLGRRGIALVGIDAQRDLRPDSVTYTQHHFDIAVGIDPDLDLEGADAFPNRLRNLAFR